MSVKISQLEFELQKLIKQSLEKKPLELERVREKYADEMVKELKAISPVGNSKRKKFKNGWTASKSGLKTVIHNKSKPGLVHILEFGTSRGVKGQYFMTKTWNKYSPKLKKEIENILKK